MTPIRNYNDYCKAKKKLISDKFLKKLNLCIFIPHFLVILLQLIFQKDYIQNVQIATTVIFLAVVILSHKNSDLKMKITSFESRYAFWQISRIHFQDHLGIDTREIDY